MRFWVVLISMIVVFPAFAKEIRIDNSKKILYLMDNGAVEKTYPVAVGSKGNQWSGSYTITRTALWPTWTPTANQHRKKKLPRFIPGGVKNPLGARALYLGSSMYRIHGTNKPTSIGRAVSNGCIRMHNKDVIDLYNRVHIGTKVTAR